MPLAHSSLMALRPAVFGSIVPVAAASHAESMARVNALAVSFASVPVRLRKVRCVRVSPAVMIWFMASRSMALSDHTPAAS